MSAPVDPVRAVLEQAWAADCQPDIYLARRVVGLRERVAELEAENAALHVRVDDLWEYGDLHECPLFDGAHLAGTDCVTYALKHGDRRYRRGGGSAS